MKCLSGAPLYGKLLALPTNVRLGWKSLPRTNTLAYYKSLEITAVKSFITLAPGQNITKLFTAVMYEGLQKARVFVPGRPFQSNLMFVG